MRDLDVSTYRQEPSSAVPALRIEPAGPDDLPGVCAVYAHARAIQKWEGAIVWPEFTEAAIRAEIDRGGLFRVIDGDELVGAFSVAYEDSALWGELERGEHVYLHRIARAERFPGRGLVSAVLVWGRAHCQMLGRTGLRLDTWASNAALIRFYERQGFSVIGRRRIGVDPRLPPHYHGNEYALLEEVHSRAE